MERICPFLALDDDARTVVSTFDPEHRCGAVRPRLALTREEQLTTCLVSDHQTCPRFLAARIQPGPAAAGWPAPAVDARFVSTRLVLGADASTGRSRSAAGSRTGAVRWVGAAAVFVGAAAVTATATGALGPLPMGGAAPADTSTPIPTATPTQQPAVGGPSPRPPTPSTTPTATPEPSPQPTRRPASTAAPTPEPRTYVVREGDTLAAIASSFGTTVEALQAANGIEDSDVILIGQVLVIP